MNKNKINKDSRLSHLVKDPNVLFIVGDVGKPFKIPKGINIIIHTASTATPTSFLKDPLGTVDSNAIGTRILLEYAKENPVENFLFFSSVDIYGTPNPKFVPTPETYTGNVDPLNPRSCYSESKRFSETLCSIFHKTYNVPTKILRLGHTYGPGLRGDKAIHEFFTKSINDKAINLKDKGQAHISFCYISDTIKGILKVMFKGKSGEAYNIGNDFYPTSIKELAKLIGEINNNTTVSVNAKPDDSIKYIRHGDVSKLKELGYKPKVSLEKGLTNFKKHINEVGL